ncbi:hypothetical protein FOZ63_031006 [Perkinsus olseni]|uniref:Uncharacterized protein n=1 Tax=Perkinsus olseni TaxID=32597 RepID=A0A7J6QTH2_PEROL|nr:hypothetical protein FOZ63_031006 [Perkinsus olseni]
MGSPELLHGSYAGTPWGYDSAIDELRSTATTKALSTAKSSPRSLQSCDSNNDGDTLGDYRELVGYRLRTSHDVAQIFLFLVASIDAGPRKPLGTKTARQPSQQERITHIEMDDAMTRRREFDAELDKEELACIVKANFPTAVSGKEGYELTHI